MSGLSHQSPSPHCLVIAEAGVNHNGSLERALDMVDAAKEAGADVVKFQTFTTAGVVTRKARKAEYQERTTGSTETQFEMIQKLELDHDAHRKIVEHCKRRGIAFMSTPFDLPSLRLLLDLKVDRLKIASGEITHARLLRECARSGLPLLMSSGMSTIGDIEAALGVIASGYLLGQKETVPTTDALSHPKALAWLRDRVMLLHCVTEYPAPYADVNLRAMDTMAAAFDLPVGYSDHTLDIFIPIGAVARGAKVIEKHFTLDKTLPGPDQSASLEPGELAAMIRGIRAVEVSLGDGRKVPAPSELKNRDIARRSLVAGVAIGRGEPFTEENLIAKRPGTGVSPMRECEYIGRVATRDYGPDEALDP